MNKHIGGPHIDKARRTVGFGPAEKEVPEVDHGLSLPGPRLLLLATDGEPESSRILASKLVSCLANTLLLRAPPMGQGKTRPAGNGARPCQGAERSLGPLAGLPSAAAGRACGGVALVCIGDGQSCARTPGRTSRPASLSGNVFVRQDTSR